jgi:hypothetical protein
MEEPVRRAAGKWQTQNLFAEQPDHERQTHKKPLFPTDLQNLMPHLDCRVAFISRGQPQEVASVASDANAARWCVALPIAGTGVTNRQSMTRTNALDDRPICALAQACSGRALDTKWPVAWIERRTGLSLRKIIASLGFRASRTRVELATCELQSTTATGAGLGARG